VSLFGSLVKHSWFHIGDRCDSSTNECQSPDCHNIIVVACSECMQSNFGGDVLVKMRFYSVH